MEAKYLNNGDTAITIQLGSRISIDVSRRVQRVLHAIEAQRIEGVEELLPTYCTLMVYYRPERIGHDALVAACRACVDALAGEECSDAAEEIVCEIPVLYGGEYGEDLEDVARFHQMSPQQVVEIHTAQDNYTYVLGGIPGMAYLGAETELHMPRRPTSRASIPKGSVIIWENQTIVMPIAHPSGWQVIGRSPVETFNMNREEPFLMRAGQWIRFRAINRAEYDAIAEQVKAGTYRCRFCGKEKMA